MTAKEKAKELIAIFGNNQFALLCAKEIKRSLEHRDIDVVDFEYTEYLEEVESEIVSSKLVFEIKGSDISNAISRNFSDRNTSL